MSDLLASKLYDSIKESDEPREFLQWHASAIAQCPRSQYYQRLGIPPLNKPGAGMMLRWRAGHIFEGEIRPHLEKIYPDLVSNVRLTSKNMDLTGEYDNYSKQNKLLIEVKTVGPRAPRYRKVGETRHHLREDGPYLSHEYQNHAYVLLLREVILPVEHITYVYITLEGLIITYETDVNPFILNNVVERLRVLKDAMLGALPDCICKPDHPLWGSTMQFCDYRIEGGECCSVKLLSDEQIGNLSNLRGEE